MEDTLSREEFQKILGRNPQDFLAGLDARIVAPAPVTKTTKATMLYVRSAGDDTNDGLTEGSALASIQAAIDKIPKLVLHEVVINVGAGAFDAFAINSRVVEGSLTIQGVLGNPSLTTGTTSGTATGGSTTSLDDSGQGWTEDDLVGNFLLVGGSRKVICSNTDTHIDVIGYFDASTDGKSYEIQESKTEISTRVLGEDCIAIQNVKSSVFPEYYKLHLKQLKITDIADYANAITVFLSDMVALTDVQVDVPTRSSAFHLLQLRSNNWVTIANVFCNNGPKYGIAVTQVSTFYSYSTLANDNGWAGVFIENLDYYEGEIQADGNGEQGIAIVGATNFLPRLMSASDNTAQGILIKSSYVSQGGYDNVMVGSGNGTWGLELKDNAHVVHDGGGTTTITGSSGDATINGGTTALDWSTDFVSNGDLVVNLDNGCRIVRVA